MEFYNNKPVIYMDVDVDIDNISGMQAASFVDRPATQTIWAAYKDVSTEIIPQAYSISTDEERLVTGPVMLANTPILRRDDSIGEYYSVYTPESIKKMMKKYFMQNKIHNVNEMHDATRIVDNVFLIESYILTETLQSTLFPDIPCGSWMATYYIDNVEYWNSSIKTGKFKGISLEGNFIPSLEAVQYQKIQQLINSNLTDEELYASIKRIL